MGIKISFDPSHNPEPPTIILAKKNGDKIGKLDSKSIEIIDYLNDASEISFNAYKYIDGEKSNFWEQIVDFKLVHCIEWDMWFEIKVELDESTETIKTVYCTQLGQAELSQIMLYNIEINTEDDIARDEYVIPTIFYNIEHPDASLLHRIMEKAPHYNIIHVDDTLKNIQRTFSFDGVSIYDSFQEISEEINCLFILNSNSDGNGNIQRTISVYDLESNCNECGYRGEFIDNCPECGSSNINDGYGKDTTIFITSDELASDIQLTSDTGAIKNCFKLEAGDDLMTATIRNCNPNGTDYVWYISDENKVDMSKELIEKIDSYDALFNEYQKKYVAELDLYLLTKYNNLVNKYKVYNDELEEISIPIIGYPNLMSAYYNTIDLEVFLRHSLMPTVEMSDTNAIQEVAKLTSENISPVAVKNLAIISTATANNAVLSMAQIVIDSRYRIKVSSSYLTRDASYQIWTGNFVVTNYSDETDTAISEVISVVVNDDYSSFVQQKIQKSLHKEDADDLSISGLFKKSYNEFVEELKKYSLDCLNSFYNSCQTCIDILVEQGITDKETWSGQEPNLYNDLYIPYLQKLNAIESELKIRQDEVDLIAGIYNTDNELITYGLQNYIDDIKIAIQDKLNFQNYLGNDLWLEFCAFRREDKYSNDNYISDGLNNAELFKKANEFIEVARKEIYKSAELQHSISTSLKNLLFTEKFLPLFKYFEVGNWMRIMIDDKIYKFRLIQYSIDFDNFENCSVEFSDVIRVDSSVKSVKEVIEQASTMATSYSTIKRQAQQGEQSNAIINNWSISGLDTTNTKIISSSNNQTQTWDSHGMLFREYDSIFETYNDEQLKIINSTIAITDDNWKTTKTAIGKFYYTDPETKDLKSAYGINGETIVGKMLIGEGLGIYNASGNLTFDSNGFVVTNGINTVTINPNKQSVFNIKNQDGNIFSFNDDGDLVIIGNITAKSLTLLGETNIESGSINGLADVAISGDYNDLINIPKESDINKKFNNPTNNDDATEGQYLSKQTEGSLWVSAETSITENGAFPICGKAVYDFALSKKQDVENANKLLQIDAEGNITFISIEDLKTLLNS